MSEFSISNLDNMMINLVPESNNISLNNWD